MRHQLTAPEVQIMTIDFRPEFLDTDDADWFFDSGDVPTINMASANAATVLDALNMVVEPCGFADAEQVLGAALTYLAVEPEDAGRPAMEESTGNWGVRFIDCGRREGYIQEKLQRIVEIATYARDHGRRVEWC